MKKRIGNDFLFYWIIKENNIVINPDDVLDFKIIIRHRRTGSEIVAEFDVVNSSPSVKCENLLNLGVYDLIATWKTIDYSFDDNYRNSSVDVQGFEIVSSSSSECETDLTVTSEIAIGFEGADAFEVWLKNGNEGKTYEDYIAFLQKPATDAAYLAADATNDAIAAASLANEKAELANAKATLADQKATLADSKATLANNAATLANEKAALADTATTNANNAEMQRVTAESGRVTAEGNRVTAENNRVTVEGNRVTSEQGRVTAETTRTTNETSRQSAENGRVTAESGRVTAETGRATAETARVSAENARNVASNVYNLTVSVPLGSGYYTLATAVAAVVVGLRKKGLVITFESAAGVWETYQFTGASIATWTTLAQWVKDINYPNVTELVELPIAEVLNVLYAKIQAIEAFIKTSQYGNVTADQVDIVRNFNVWGKTNLIIEGTAAPAVVPDFVGQTFVNTVGGVTYTAKGIASVADWKQTSN